MKIGRSKSIEWPTIKWLLSICETWNNRRRYHKKKNRLNKVDYFKEI